MVRSRQLFAIFLATLLLACGAIGTSEEDQTSPPVDSLAHSGDGEANPVARLSVPLASGSHATCAIQNGEIWCWGGVDPCEPSFSSGTARRVDGLSGAVQVSVGARSACALVEDGTVHCWSLEWPAAQLDSHSLPLFPVPNLTEVVSIAAGNDACAIDSEGRLWCWAFSDEGITGPDYVDLPTDVAEVQFGNGWFACAVLTNGDTWCWDSGNWDVTAQEADYQVNAAQLDLAFEVAHIGISLNGWCAASETGDLECWTDMPDGPDLIFTGPVAGAPVADLIALDGGDDTLCASYANGDVLCWYDGHGPGESWQPWADPMKSVALGSTHQCSVDQDGALWCQGKNDTGQLGQGGAANSVSIRDTSLKLPEGLSALETSEALTCLLDSDGTINCWGGAQPGEGLPSYEGLSLSSPEPGAKWVDLSVGGSYFDGSQLCGLTVAGAVWCVDYQAGAPPEAADWQLIDLPRPAVDVAADDRQQGCAITVGGPPVCWDRSKSLAAADVPGVADEFEQLSCFLDRCCTVHGEVGTVCFDNSVALDRDGANVSAFPGLPGIDVSVGQETSCVLTNDGSVWCWGFNGRCGLGSDTTMPIVAQPLQVPIEGEVVALAAGRHFHCGKLASGGLVCWGELDEACHLDLDGDPASCSTLPLVSDTFPGAAFKAPATAFLAAAADHLLVGLADFPLKSFGNHDYGEIPGGPVPSSDIPLRVDLTIH